jgi:sirohydrochlorin cobaltochelatase
MERKVGIVVVAHGSRRPGGNETLLRFVGQLRERLGAARVEPAFMGLGEPTIAGAVGRLVARGCDHIFGYALFFAPGAHLGEDVPVLFREAVSKHPGVTFEISPPLLEDAAMLEFVADRLRAVR